MIVDLSVIYIADELNPESISQLLGVQPTRSRKKNDSRKNKDGSETIFKKGLWSWKTQASGGNDAINEAVEKMSDAFSKVLTKLSIRENYEHSYIDFYILLKEEEKIDGSISFPLSAQSIQTLAITGLPIDVTISISEEDDE